MAVRHKILDQHDSICWDMDGTLVANHFPAPNADFFHSYIKAHPQKRHVILTFRNKEWADEIYDELEGLGMRNARSLISEIISCPSMIHDSYMMHTNRPHMVDRFKDHFGLDDETFMEYVDAFTFWKGKMAKAAGCTILVDDLPEWVVDGCTEHGVVFLHAHEEIDVEA